MKRAIVLTLFFAACSGSAGTTGGSGSSGSSGTTGHSNFTMQFSLSSDVRSDSNATRPFIGNVYGSIYHSEDVSFTGPKDGGQPVADVEVDGVNLEDAGTGLSTQVWTSPDLPPGSYTFLGAFDTNGDGGKSGSPTCGDVVTLPDHSVVIPDAGGTAFLNAQFDLVWGPSLCN